MHAVVVNLTINDPDGDLRVLRDRVVPLMSQAPGSLPATGHGGATPGCQ